LGRHLNSRRRSTTTHSPSFPIYPTHPQPGNPKLASPPSRPAPSASCSESRGRLLLRRPSRSAASPTSPSLSPAQPRRPLLPPPLASHLVARSSGGERRGGGGSVPARLDDPTRRDFDLAPAAADLGGGCDSGSSLYVCVCLCVCLFVCMCGGGGVWRRRPAAPSPTPAADLGGGRLRVLPLLVCVCVDARAAVVWWRAAAAARRWGPRWPPAPFLF
jgi:hypothetical protein